MPQRAARPSGGNRPHPRRTSLVSGDETFFFVLDVGVWGEGGVLRLRDRHSTDYACLDAVVMHSPILVRRQRREKDGGGVRSCKIKLLLAQCVWNRCHSFLEPASASMLSFDDTRCG